MTSAKRNKIIYWIATVWLALGMVSTGIVQLLKVRKKWRCLCGSDIPPIY